ncbi:MAG: hypothetical protein WCG97_01800 [bacterium]
MKKIIHHLKQQPVHVRKMVALGTTIVITGVIVIFWITGLVSTGFATNGNDNKLADNEPSPLAVLGDQIKGMGQVIGNQLASVGSVFGSLQGTSTSDMYSASSTSNQRSTIIQGSIGISTSSIDSSN